MTSLPNSKTETKKKQTPGHEISGFLNLYPCSQPDLSEIEEPDNDSRLKNEHVVKFNEPCLQ